MFLWLDLEDEAEVAAQLRSFLLFLRFTGGEKCSWLLLRLLLFAVADGDVAVSSYDVVVECSNGCERLLSAQIRLHTK